MIKLRCQFAHQRDRSSQNSRSVGRQRRPWACSLQHREPMAQANTFQQEVKALAEPRLYCRKSAKDPSRHELYAIPSDRATATNI
jgi:hypothetical protein